MSVNVNLKCKFAELKYEQLLSEKYFVETCFSKKYSSYNSKQSLADMLFKIKSVIPVDTACLTTVEEIDCSTTTTTTTASPTTTTTSTEAPTTTTTTTTP